MSEKCTSGTKISKETNKMSYIIILSTPIENTLLQHTVNNCMNNLFLVLSCSKTGKCHAHWGHRSLSENLQNKHFGVWAESNLCVWPTSQFPDHWRSGCGYPMLHHRLNYRSRLWNPSLQQKNFLQQPKQSWRFIIDGLGLIFPC